MKSIWQQGVVCDDEDDNAITPGRLTKNIITEEQRQVLFSRFGTESRKMLSNRG